MPYAFDSQLTEAIAPIKEMKKQAGPVPVHDVKRRRDDFEQLSAVFNDMPTPPNVKHTEYTTKTSDGYDLILHWYTPTNSTQDAPGPAVAYFHGGGMILGSVGTFEKLIQANVAASGTPFLAVSYRLAPEHPHPTPVEDCYAGLAWLSAHAAELHVDAARIAVFGESAGGGLAAGVALLARDRALAPPLARQILVYPMLDDRTVAAEPAVRPFLVIWDDVDNMTGWAALLGREAVGGEGVSEYAAPARAKSVRGLPPTYIDVGTLDLFRDEDLEYARRLIKGEVGCELHVYPGVPHGFEMFNPDSEVTKMATQNRIRALRSF